MVESVNGEAAVLPSKEETDVLERSRKKVRKGDTLVGNEGAVVPREEDWMMDDVQSKAKEQQRKTYSQACANEVDPASEEDEDFGWWMGEGWKEKLRVEQTARGPNIIVLPEFKRKLAKKWRLTLIVRLMGQMVREQHLGQKLERLWANKGNVETLEFGSGYFIVNFTHKDDYEYALTEGPWLIWDHYLTVQPWKPDFDPDEEEVSKMAVWVRIPKFPMDYYDQGILYVVGNQIGTVLRLDSNTLHQSKARFARLCVEIDLKKPLLPMILINGKEKKVVYEGLHFICFNCGRYGHDQDHCPDRTDTVSSRNDGVQQRSQTVAPAKTSQEEDALYGGWMVRQSRRNSRRIIRDANLSGKQDSHGYKNQGIKGSRYSALMTDDVEEISQADRVVTEKTTAQDPELNVRTRIKVGKPRGQATEINNAAGKIMEGKGQDANGNKNKPSPMEDYMRIKTQMDYGKRPMEGTEVQAGRMERMDIDL